MLDLFQDWQSKILDNIVWGTISAVLIALFADGIRMVLRAMGVASGKLPTFLASVFKAFEFPKVTFWVAFEPVLVVIRIIYALLLSLSVVATGAAMVILVAFVLMSIFMPGGPEYFSPLVRNFFHLDSAGMPTEQSLAPLAGVLTLLSTLLLAIPGMSGFIAGLGRIVSGLLFVASWVLLLRALFSLSFHGVVSVQDHLSTGGSNRVLGAKIGAYIACTIAAIPTFVVLQKQYDWSLKALGFRIAEELPAATRYG